MKITSTSLLATGLAVLAFSAPAQAALSIDTLHCVSVTDSAGCKFLGGNLATQSNADAAEALYNAAKNPDIILDLLGTNPASTPPSFGSITFDSVANLSGTWSTPGHKIDYLGVKAGNNFILYAIGGVSSGAWSTTGLLNPQGNAQQALSHLAFFGSVSPAVPEPASWALMIVGFGAIGTTMRRRTANSAIRFA